MNAKADLEFFPDPEQAGARTKRRPKRLRAGRIPDLTMAQILEWLDQYFARTGQWPTRDSGLIIGSVGETWMAVNMALQKGHRGLPGNSSLAQFLQEHRGVRNRARLSRLTRMGILQWADAHKQRKGKWPTDLSGAIPEAPGESWRTVDKALRKGSRGLRGRSSLAQLLEKYRGKRNHTNLPKLSVGIILKWADAWFKRHGWYPTSDSGPIPEAPGETWGRVANALVKGLRGLPGGSSLAQLLAEYRNVRNAKALPKLRIYDILAWADAYHARRGVWPTHKSGSIQNTREMWSGVNTALQDGNRGLRGGSSLYKLLRAKRKIPPRRIPPGRW